MYGFIYIYDSKCFEVAVELKLTEDFKLDFKLITSQSKPQVLIEKFPKA